MQGSALSQAELEMIYLDTEDPRNIYCLATGSEWNAFSDGIIASVGNRNLNKLPLIKLNADGSISVFLHKCTEAGCSECKETKAFEESFQKTYITDQLDYHRKKMGLSLTGGREKIVETKPYDAVSSIIEYQINLSPEDFDSILKLNSQYSGYRAENSVLKLNRHFDLKKGVIRLFPVAALDEGSWIMRAEGCQIIEMPSVQILHLMPDFDGKERHFHWAPKEVEETLRLGRFLIGSIISDALKKQGMLDKQAYLELQGYPNFIMSPFDGPIRIVDMDPKAQDFYLLYGNASKEELAHAKSVEMDSLAFLNEAKAHLQGKVHAYYEKPESYPYENIAALEKAVALLDYMIQVEQLPPLHSAILKGDKAAFAAALASPDNEINTVSPYFGPPLFMALVQERFNMAAGLLNDERLVLSDEEKHQILSSLSRKYVELGSQGARLLPLLMCRNFQLNEQELATLFPGLVPNILNYIQTNPEKQARIGPALLDKSTILGQFFAMTKRDTPADNATATAIRDASASSLSVSAERKPE